MSFLNHYIQYITHILYISFTDISAVSHHSIVSRQEPYPCQPSFLPPFNTPSETSKSHDVHGTFTIYWYPVHVLSRLLLFWQQFDFVQRNWVHVDLTLWCLSEVNVIWQSNFQYNIKNITHWKAFTVYPKKYAHGFCFAVLCCGYTLTDFPISIRLTSLALGQSDDCPSASKATLMNIDKYFIWIHYERLHNHNKAKHNKTVCIFLGIYCRYNFDSLIINNLTLAEVMAWCHQATHFIQCSQWFTMPYVITRQIHSPRAPSQYKDRLIYVWRFPC